MPQSFIAEVLLTHPNAPLAPTLAAVPHPSITEESIRPATTADKPAIIYRVTDVEFDAFEAELDRDHTVAEWAQTMDFGDTRMYRIQLAPATIFVSPTLSELGIHVVNSESADRGWRFRLETGDRDHLGALWDYCRETDIQFRLEVLQSSGAQPMDERIWLKAALTDRQQQVARVATRMGYYEKGGASANDVAAELNIAPSTLSTHLRRINATIFNSLFTSESD